MSDVDSAVAAAATICGDVKQTLNRKRLTRSTSSIWQGALVKDPPPNGYSNSCMQWVGAAVAAAAAASNSCSQFVPNTTTTTTTITKNEYIC